MTLFDPYEYVVITQTSERLPLEPGDGQLAVLFTTRVFREDVEAEDDPVPGPVVAEMNWVHLNFDAARHRGLPPSLFADHIDQETYDLTKTLLPDDGEPYLTALDKAGDVLHVLDVTVSVGDPNVRSMVIVALVKHIAVLHGAGCKLMVYTPPADDADPTNPGMGLAGFRRIRDTDLFALDLRRRGKFIEKG